MKTMVAQKAQIKVCDTTAEFAKEAAKEVVAIISDAIKANGRCTIALSGGSTPALLYEQLISPEFLKKVDWTKAHFFVGDERCVPIEDKESNFGNAERQFLSKLNLPPENLHPTSHQDTSPAEAAQAYEDLLVQFFGLKPGEYPRFDLILLGMGPDGHTASLFPTTKALKETKRLVVDNHVDKLQAMRLTFTFPLINHARNIIIMVQGTEKAHVIGEVLTGEVVSYPVQHVIPESGKLQWILDKNAAADFLKNS